MNKNNENKLVPKLRFPEFINDEGWEETTLGKISDITNGKSNAQDHIENGKYPLFDRSAVIKASNNFLFDCEAVIIPGEGMRFIPKYYNGKFDLHQRAYVLKDFSIDGMFGYYSMSHRSDLLALKAVKSTVLSLRLPILQNFPIQIPKSRNEQQKIAACLSSLDEVITAESQKLEVLKDHKKGLLQNLLPQAGETVPKFRFKEFEDSGEWVEKKLGEVYEFKVTNSFSRECLNYLNGEVKNIHYGDIHTKFNTLFDITKEYVPYINPDLPIDKIREDCYCKEGDIIFADASEDLNDVGKSIEIVNLNGEKLVSGLHTLLARQKDDVLNIGFGGFLFKTYWIRKQIQREAQGAKVLGISASRISNINIKFPKSKAEQQKIASTLSSLDDLIMAQNQKLEALQLHKKGLLQGLFPNVNEVTE